MKSLLLLCVPLTISACALSPGIDIPWGSGGTSSTGGASAGTGGGVPCDPAEISCEPALEAPTFGGADGLGGHGGEGGATEDDSTASSGGAP